MYSTNEVIPISVPTPFVFGPVNTYLIKSQALVLVDTGPKTEDAYVVLSKALLTHGVTSKDLDAILITHGHLDHMGLLARLLAESSAQAYAHPIVVQNAAEYEANENESKAFFERVLHECGAPLAAVNVSRADRESFSGYGERVVIQNAVDDLANVCGFTVYHVPGHSATDMVYVDATQRVAFTGDHVLPKMNPNPLIRRPPPGTPRPKSLVEYRASLMRTRSLDLAVCYPGHGNPVTDHRALIDTLLRRQDDRTAKIRAFMSTGGPKTPYEVVVELFPKLDLENLFLALSVAVGHLELLETEGDTNHEYCEGILYYRLT